jgi:hypothetical protein
VTSLFWAAYKRRTMGTQISEPGRIWDLGFST